jgi:hypothetical protein
VALEAVGDWHELVGLTPRDEEDRPRLKRLLESIVAQVTASDVSDLVALCDEGTPEESCAAVRVIYLLLARADARLDAEQRFRYSEYVRAAAYRSFPADRLGREAFWALREVDGEEAENLLIEKLESVATMTEVQADWLVLNLSAMRSRRALAALRSARGLPPEVEATRGRILRRLRDERPELFES